MKPGSKPGQAEIYVLDYGLHCCAGHIGTGKEKPTAAVQLCTGGYLTHGFTH